jgi:hypothetical protein
MVVWLASLKLLKIVSVFLLYSLVVRVGMVLYIVLLGRFGIKCPPAQKRG